eukprot:Nitzschia sp. Nitz4//scaffold194_size40385//10955//11674//NITZ4_007526-RA/size40385-processed-gene-0.32-mRNA-1//1//CDS//3329540322//7247//frame0
MLSAISPKEEYFSEYREDRMTCSTFSQSECKPVFPSSYYVATETVDSSFTKLPFDFSPCDHDVIVGTGREAKCHKGNLNLVLTLRRYLKRYSEAPCKLMKSLIISEIVKDVTNQSATGAGFVKRINSVWYEVGDQVAREKISQGLRNLLYSQYRSSTQRKKARRNKLCQTIDDSVDRKIRSKHSFFHKRLVDLTNAVERCGGSRAPDEEVLHLFSQANSDILEQLKQEASPELTFSVLE